MHISPYFSPVMNITASFVPLTGDKQQYFNNMAWNIVGSGMGQRTGVCSTCSLLFQLIHLNNLGLVASELHMRGRIETNSFCTGCRYFVRNSWQPFRFSSDKHKKSRNKSGILVLVRPGRIELPTEHWQCPVIPLNHGRIFDCTGVKTLSMRAQSTSWAFASKQRFRL